jgi:hypothetical protein
MNIPGKIKIGGFWYKVIIQDTVEEGYHSGIAEELSHTIHIAKFSIPSGEKELKPVCPEEMWATFVHELTHVLTWTYLGKDVSERHTTVLANGICQVCIDNPGVFTVK